MSSPGASHPPLDAAQAERLSRAIEEHGLKKHTAAILAASRPTLLLQAGAIGDVPAGSTRLGGDPDLPPGTPWPEVKGRPLMFIAQVRLEELPIPEGWPLPRAGLLSFFMGDDEDRFDVEHAVVFSQATEKLVRVPTPDLGEEHEALRACSATARLGITVPGYGDDDLFAMKLEDDEMDAYFGFREGLEPDSEASLLGRDFDVDEKPTEKHAIRTLGGKEYDSKWKRAHAEAVHAEASRWVPLFQMESNFALGLNMWDAYTFLALIRWDDLAAGRFDRTHAQLARR